MFERGYKTWCENISASLRKELALESKSPIDLDALAKHLGIFVWEAKDVPGVDKETLGILLETDSSSWSAFTIYANGRSLIVLNSSHFGGRRASNLCHELAHLILGHEPARLDVAEGGHLVLHSFDQSQEQEADWLSGCLLLPRVALLACRKEGLSIEDIASKFGASKQMATYRLNASGVERQLARGRK